MANGRNDPQACIKEVDSVDLAGAVRESRVLLVDPRPVSEIDFVARLKTRGCRLTTAQTGSAALILFAAGRIDVVIATLKFSDMTVTDLLSGLKLASPLIPVIVVADSTDPTLVLSIMRAGAIDVLSAADASGQILDDVFERALEQVAACNQLRDSKMPREARQFAAEQDARLQAVLTSTFDPLITINCRGTIESASDSVERDFGWKASELIGKDVKVLIPKRFRRAHDVALERYLKKGETSILGQPRDIEVLHKDGTSLPCEITVWKSEVPGQASPLFTAILRDIRARKGSEEAMQKHLLDLEMFNKVSSQETERISRLAEELSAAREHAEQAAKAKTEFLANMSHEIRTPMTAILGFTDTLLDEETGDEERVDAIQTIRRNGHHLLSIINDILDLSKIESGKLNVELVECPLMQIVADVVSLMTRQAAEKNLAMTYRFEGPVPATIQTDPTRLRQILMNLLGNAIKFTSQGRVELVVELLKSVDGLGNLLAFHVVDTGIGIPKEQQARLFDPFSQADASTTRKFGGTGLGLAICMRLTRVLGGGISLQSTLGSGSTFSATIDPGSLTKVSMLSRPPEIESQVAAESRRLTKNQILQGRRILVAEDGLDNQKLLLFILRKAGADVKVCDNGKEALDATWEGWESECPFDVVLMDMQMPVMDGYEATRQLRQRGYTGPIIALTAHSMRGNREECLDAGCDDYSSKPIQREELLELIDRYAAKKTPKATESSDTDSDAKNN